MVTNGREQRDEINRLVQRLPRNELNGELERTIQDLKLAKSDGIPEEDLEVQLLYLRGYRLIGRIKRECDNLSQTNKEF